MNGLIRDKRLDGRRDALEMVRAPIHTQENISRMTIYRNMIREANRRYDPRTRLVSEDYRRGVMTRGECVPTQSITLEGREVMVP